VGLSREFVDQYGDAAYVEMMQNAWVPWMLDGLDLGEEVLDLIVGPGPTVPSLRAAGRRLTVGQAAPAFTAAVARRFADDPDVVVTDVDLWQLPFADGRFSAVTAVLALHHAPSIQLQDRTLREVARVLRPGGVLVGLNALDGPHFRRMNTDGACVPVEPLGFPERLRAAGLVAVTETVWSFVRFTGHAPCPDLPGAVGGGR
jgi:SAM-dependent methyltransferase